MARLPPPPSQAAIARRILREINGAFMPFGAMFSLEPRG
jgi:hypothetical protein